MRDEETIFRFLHYYRAALWRVREQLRWIYLLAIISSRLQHGAVRLEPTDPVVEIVGYCKEIIFGILIIYHT
jgi:hypothetical protein